MTSSSLIAIIVILLFVITAAWAVLYFRRDVGARRQKLLALGFRPVETPDQAIIQHLTSLSGVSSNNLSIRNVAFRRDLECELYLFDMWDSSNNRGSQLYEGGVMVISPCLKLPRFTLLPFVAAEGKLAELANRLLEKIPIPGKEDVRIEIDPQFERRYRLLGEDEAEVRTFFSPERLNRLNDTSYWMIEAQGNLFIFNERKYDPTRKNLEGSLEERVRDALTAFHILRD